MDERRGPPRNGEITIEDFDLLLARIYKEGADPEIVIGKCPRCGEPFHYEHGKVLAGHWLSDCPKETK